VTSKNKRLSVLIQHAPHPRSRRAWPAIIGGRAALAPSRRLWKSRLFRLARRATVATGALRSRLRGLFSSPVDAWTFRSGDAEVAAPIRTRFVVNTDEAAIEIAAERRAGSLYVALQSFEPPPSPVHPVYASGGLPPLKLRAFLDFAAPRLK